MKKPTVPQGHSDRSRLSPQRQHRQQTMVAQPPPPPRILALGRSVLLLCPRCSNTVEFRSRLCPSALTGSRSVIHSGMGSKKRWTSPLPKRRNRLRIVSSLRNRYFSSSPMQCPIARHPTGMSERRAPATAEIRNAVQVCAGAIPRNGVKACSFSPNAQALIPGVGLYLMPRRPVLPSPHAFPPQPEPVQIQINHRRGVQGQHLAHHEPAHNRDA